MTLSLPLLGAGVVLGTASQRITGMGFAMLMAPFFALAFGPYEGILLMNLGGAVSSSIMLARVWSGVDWRRWFFLASAALPGGLVGWWVIKQAEPSILQIVIGGSLVIGLLVLQLTKPRPGVIPEKTGALVAGGIFGFTGVTAGFGAPFVALYALGSGWDLRKLAATLQPLFVGVSAAAFIAKTWSQHAPPSLDWWIYVALIVLIVTGMAVGEILGRRVNVERAPTWVRTLCYLGATAAVLDGVLGLV